MIQASLEVGIEVKIEIKVSNHGSLRERFEAVSEQLRAMHPCHCERSDGSGVGSNGSQ